MMQTRIIYEEWEMLFFNTYVISFIYLFYDGHSYISKITFFNKRWPVEGKLFSKLGGKLPLLRADWSALTSTSCKHGLS